MNNTPLDLNKKMSDNGSRYSKTFPPRPRSSEQRGYDDARAGKPFEPGVKDLTLRKEYSDGYEIGRIDKQNIERLQKNEPIDNDPVKIVLDRIDIEMFIGVVLGLVMGIAVTLVVQQVL